METLKKERKFNAFDIPGIYYLEAGNIFTGSKGNLNFKIVPEKAHATFTVTIWHGFLCSDLAEPEDTRTFPLTTDGHQALLDWLTALEAPDRKTTDDN